MKLYYTGASDFLKSQNNPLQSLGGYISNSAMANGGIGGLFGSISQKSLRNGTNEFRAVALKNETSVVKTVTLFYNNVSKNPVSSLKMGLVMPATDTCDGLYVEEIASIYNKPISGKFIDNRGEVNALKFTIDPGQYIGVWVERSINRFKGNQMLSCENMLAQFDTVDTSQQFDVQITDNNVIGTYWTFNTVDSRLYVWYDDNAAPNTVNVEDREGIRVGIDQGDTIGTVVDKTISALQSTIEARGEILVTKNTSTINVEQTQAGKVQQPTIATAPVTISQTQGDSSDEELIESLEVTIDYV